MSELHKFLFEGLPVRGMLVRLDQSWRDLLSRRSGDKVYAPEVRKLLGEMCAAGALMQSNIKFNGALILQVAGEGPVKLAVAEVQPDLSFRATAKVVAEVPSGADLGQLVNTEGHGRCAITLDPKDRQPGQQPYQGIVPLNDRDGQSHARLAPAIQHYMLQSEQLETTLVLAANDELAAGLLIQRMPMEGEGNLEGQISEEELAHRLDAYNRISLLASTLTEEELLTLDAETVLRRLFWEENVRRFEPLRPRFACTCSRERVGQMLVGLGQEEIESVLAERGDVEVGCEFCGAQYRFDAVDAAALFTAAAPQSGSEVRH